MVNNNKVINVPNIVVIIVFIKILETPKNTKGIDTNVYNIYCTKFPQNNTF